MQALVRGDIVQPIVVVPADDHAKVILRTDPSYVKITLPGYDDLVTRSRHEIVPTWLTDAIDAKWDIDTSGRTIEDTLHIRDKNSFGYEAASWELNLLCNYHCAHCYLGERPNASLDMKSRLKVLQVMNELGVYQLQLTGGEPLIDRHFIETYLEAYRLGMVLTVSTNGSWLCKPAVIETIEKYRPLRLTVSLYGASADSYETLTGTPRGMFDRFMRGVRLASSTGMNLRINIIVTKHNESETKKMQDLAASLTDDYYTYSHMSASIHGSSDPLMEQASCASRPLRQPFPGCDAGVRSFHVDPLGRASMCKIGRQPFVMIGVDGPECFAELAAASRAKLARNHDCSTCAMSEMCTTCPLIVENYRAANAPRSFYCLNS